MTSVSHLLRFSPLSPHDHNHRRDGHVNLSAVKTLLLPQTLTLAFSGGGGGIGIGGSGGGGGGDSRLSSRGFGSLGLFLEGWQSRVAADPQFPFKVLMEELVGVTACIARDMASRPNFGSF